MKVSLQILPALVAACSLACADVGKFVWVRDYRAGTDAGRRGFVLAPGDVVQVRLFGQEAFTTKARVRADGKISLPLLHDVDAAGYAPVDLGQQLETRYKDFVRVPAVTVSVEEVRALSVSVAGEVVKQGVVTAERGSSLLQVLLLAGGPNDFAHRDRIFVLRGAPKPTRIRFTWESLLRGEPAAAQFEIAAGDTVVVE